MSGNYKLGDGTCVVVEPAEWKLAKKFGGLQTSVAIILTLFPQLREALGETMYSLIPEHELVHFIRVIIATVMIEERFGKLPDYCFDDLYGMVNSTVFNVYEDDGELFTLSISPSATLHQLSISDAAVEKMIALLTNAKKEDEVIPEAVVAVEDVTEELYGETGSHVTYDLQAPSCQSCELCDAIEHRAHEHGQKLYDNQVTDQTCQKIAEEHFLQPLRIYSSLLRHNSLKILRFGESSFRKVKHSNPPNATDTLGNKLWFLYRMPWHTFDVH